MCCVRFNPQCHAWYMPAVFYLTARCLPRWPPMCPTDPWIPLESWETSRWFRRFIFMSVVENESSPPVCGEAEGQINGAVCWFSADNICSYQVSHASVKLYCFESWVPSVCTERYGSAVRHQVNCLCHTWWEISRLKADFSHLVNALMYFTWLHINPDLSMRIFLLALIISGFWVIIIIIRALVHTYTHTRTHTPLVLSSYFKPKTVRAFDSWGNFNSAFNKWNM